MGVTSNLEEEPIPAPQTGAATDMDEETFKTYTGLVNYYIHQINMIRHLLGEPYRPTYADPSGRLMVAQTDSGVCCVLEMSPYRTTLDWQETALVAFERGYVKLRFPAPLARRRAGEVEILRDPGGGATPVVERPHLPSVDAMRQQAINFVEAVRGEERPACEAKEALGDLVIAREHIRLLRGLR